MKVRTILLIGILAFALAALTWAYGRPKPETKPVIEEVEILKYEPIDFKEILTKPEVVSISTERDPFKSPVEAAKLLEGQQKDKSELPDAESLRLIGIVRGPNGPVALIKPTPEQKAQAVKPNSMIGKFWINKITDKEVILTLNGVKTVLKLGGGEND